MTDSISNPANDPTNAPETPEFDAALVDLLRAVEGVSPGGPHSSGSSSGRTDGALPDPARVSAHFSGMGDAALLDAAAEREDVRRLLGDLASVVDPEPESLEVALGGDRMRAAINGNGTVSGKNSHAHSAPVPAPLSDAVRARALAAFDGDVEVPADVEPEDVAPLPEPALESATAPKRALVWRAAAAVLLVGGSAALLATLASRSVEAGPALALEAIERLDGQGVIAAEGPRHARLGQRFVAGESRRLSLRLAGGARVVLGAGDELRVACDGTECGRAALALDHGEALVSAPRPRAAKEPSADLAEGVRILLPDGGVLDVRSGAAHVAVSKSGEPLISLREDGVAYYFPGGSIPFPRTGHPQRLVGPTTNGPAAATLFRDLEFFGGALRRGSLDREVSAPLWRILKGNATGNHATRALARASDAEGLPAVRFDLAPGESARLAWLPDGAALAAGSLDVRVETRSGTLSPTGKPVPDAPLGRLEVSVAGALGASGDVAASDRTDGMGAPGRVELALPSGWGAGGGGREVELVFSAKDAPVRAWFTGAVFRMPEVRLPEGASPGGGR